MDMRLHEIRHIDRPLDEVFAFTADFANVDEWDPGVKSSERVGGGDTVSIGTRYDVLVSFGASEFPMTYEIVELEAGRRVVLEGKSSTVDAVDEIQFEATDGGTLVDYTAQLSFHNWIRFVEPLLSPVLRKVGVRALDGLADRLR